MRGDVPHVPWGEVCAIDPARGCWVLGPGLFLVLLSPALVSGVSHGAGIPSTSHMG